MSKKGNIFSITIKTIFYIIAAIILIIFSMIIYKTIRYPNKIPDVFGIKPMIVVSSSMEPEINVGDLAFVKMVDTDTIKEKDIVAFRNNEDTVTTHRVIDVTEIDGNKCFTTKGDNNASDDSTMVSPSDIEGIYISKIPKLGEVLMVVQQPIVLAIILLVILVGGLICLLIRWKCEKNGV